MAKNSGNFQKCITIITMADTSMTFAFIALTSLHKPLIISIFASFNRMENVLLTEFFFENCSSIW